MSAVACAHPRGAKVIQRNEVVQAFGSTADAQIPEAPGYAKLQNGISAPVLLSRLECGHFTVTSSPTTAERFQALKDQLQGPTIRSLPKAEDDLKKLLADVRAGKDVSPADVAAAREAVALAAIAEEGRLERLRAEYEQAQAAALAAIEDPLVEELTESRDHLEELQRNAVQAIIDLLAAVDEDAQLHDEAAGQLIQHGADPTAVQQVRGYVQTTTVKGQAFPRSMSMEWVVGLLNAVKHATGNTNCFYGMEGRDLGKGIPPNCPGTPVPEM